MPAEGPPGPPEPALTPAPPLPPPPETLNDDPNLERNKLLRNVVDDFWNKLISKAQLN